MGPPLISIDIEFRPTDQHANADGLSRLPLADSVPMGNPHDASVFNVSQLESLPVLAKDVAIATRRDPILSKLLRHIRNGWPSEVPENLIPFWRRREGLSTESDCVLWGCRVVIPKGLRKRVLEELHQGHTGVVRMKAVARSHVWWPDLDKSIEKTAKNCSACQTSNKNSPAKAPLHPWVWPTAPWERVHVDFAGPFLGKMFFVATDSHSKWPEIISMSSTTATTTIEVIRILFARNGIPRQLISDNGPQFIADEFRQFLINNGVKHIRSSPYHPATNGAAERLVQTMKKSFKADHHRGFPVFGFIPVAIQVYSSYYYWGDSIIAIYGTRTPYPITPVMSRCGRICSRSGISTERSRELDIGQSVWARNFRDGPKWIQAEVSDCIGPLSYLVKLPSGETWRRHIDHLRAGLDKPSDNDTRVNIGSDTGMSTDQTDTSPGVEPQELLPTETAEVPMSFSHVPVIEPEINQPDSNLPDSNLPRYPLRTRKPPERLC